MEKLEGSSLNIEKDNIQKLKELFPDVFVEGKLNYDMLKARLGEQIDESFEKYSFSWNGKAKSIKIAQTGSQGTLRPVKSESIDWENTNNLYIEGDNLEVLKQLQKTYFGKVNIIYIDPPYNTGKDFVYHDNFGDSIENYLKQTKQTNTYNAETNGRFHTEWLNMIYPRLILCRNLLSSDGIIMISIDENEIAQLRMLCDSVFGEENRLAINHIQVRYDNKQTRDIEFLPVMEYVLIYAKNKSIFKPNLPYEDYNCDKFIYEIKENGSGSKIEVGNDIVDVFKKGEWEIIKHEQGDLNLLKETWITGSIYSDISYGKIYQKVVEPRIDIDGLGSLYKIYGRGEDGLGYRYYTNPQKLGATKGKTYSGIPLQRLEEIKTGEAKRFKPISNYYNYAADFGNIRHEGGIPFNSGKKPVKMLKELLNYSSNKNALILDFFSGSGSTAQAVLELNKEDGGNRNYILVQFPELVDDKNTLYKEKNISNICDIAKYRLRYINEQHNSTYNLLEDNIDYGFKVFSLDSSNLKAWDNVHEMDENSLFAIQDVFKEDRSNEDILYEIMLKYGVFDYPVSNVDVNGKTMYRVGKRYMLVCLEDNVTEEDIKGIISLQPRVVIFKEAGFHSDNDKMNAEYNLQKNGVEDIKCI